MPFAFFDHTGDIGLRLSAPTLEGLFATAADGLFATLTNPDEIEVRQDGPVQLTAGDVDLLLVDWLSELLFRFERDSFLVRAATVVVRRDGGRCHLDGTIAGEPFDAARHHIKVLVKAVTYHGLRVTPTADGWAAEVILDV